MKKILTVIGARPQFVKAAVLSRALQGPRWNGQFQEILVHTGQHYDNNMSQVFFDEMGIPAPHINLQVGSGSHGRMTGEMLGQIETLLLSEKPDALLVYGDTNSTLAGALAASKLQVPVVHVEAGLRSFMMAMPEEQNRRMTDHLATWLFCPTVTALGNLAREGIHTGEVRRPTPDHKYVTNCGDIMLEASRYYQKVAEERPPTQRLGARFPIPQHFGLLTIHRAENTDGPQNLASIVGAINQLSDREFVFPVHPRTRKILEQQGLSFGSHVHVMDPVGYLDMIELESACDLVVTDSGGVQKEAYFFGKPCVTLRPSTEWTELVDSGWNLLAGADRDLIVHAVMHASAPSKTTDLYGDGNCSQKILESLKLTLGVGS